jgi:hypothetical protein
VLHTLGTCGTVKRRQENDSYGLETEAALAVLKRKVARPERRSVVQMMESVAAADLRIWEGLTVVYQVGGCV